MTLELQWAKASLPAVDKDEDAVFVRAMSGDVGLLLGVADGISTANGRHAAQWIAGAMCDLARDPDAASWDVRQLFERFTAHLADAARATRLEDSHSTLSCGIVRAHHRPSGDFVRFEFFAVGDSPIWRVFRPATSALAFQASVVYGPPVPSELAGLYSWVNLGQGCVEGQVHFGSVDVQPGELLIVSTDGVPESRVLFDDQDPDAQANSPRLLDRLMQASALGDSMLWRLLKDYDDLHLLIDDDASLVVVRYTGAGDGEGDGASLAPAEPAQPPTSPSVTTAKKHFPKKMSKADRKALTDKALEVGTAGKANATKSRGKTQRKSRGKPGAAKKGKLDS